MIRRFAAACVLAFAAVGAEAQDIEYTRHNIIVIDNSGAVWPGDQSGSYDRFYRARNAFAATLGQYRREDLVTVLSVARPRVIWSGSGSLIDKRGKNATLIEFLGAEINGCSSFADVIRRVKQQVARNPDIPVGDIVFFSSLVETGPRPCTYDPKNATPPEAFYEGVYELSDGEGTRVRFLWTDELTYDATLDFFLDRNVPADVLGVEETIQELGG